MMHLVMWTWILAALLPATAHADIMICDVTLADADRNIITLFPGGAAVHTRHFMLDQTPMAQSVPGGCVRFY